jgi:hypothetical protein
MKWLLLLAGLHLAGFNSSAACERAKDGLKGLFARAYGGQLIGLSCRKQ